MTSNLLAALKSNQEKNNLAALSPLIEAAKNGQLEGVERSLLEPKVKVDQRDSDGITALMHASSAGFIEIVRFLVLKGGRIGAKDDIGETSLMKAAKEGQIHVVSFFVEMQSQQKSHTKKFVDMQPDKSVAASQSMSLMHASTSLSPGKENRQSSQDRNSSKQAKTLDAMERKRMLDVKDDEGINSLMKASEAGELEVVDYLLQQGATSDAHDDEGWNCLMWAALSGQTEVCELLVKEWSLPAEFSTHRSETPLMKAAAGGHWDVCQFLLSEGAKINHHDVDYQTCLMWAAAEGHQTAVQGLLAADAKIEVTTKNGESALFFACMFGRMNVAKVLIQAGARVSERTREGQTCLFAAVRCGHRELCELLLDEGCPLEAITQRGQTALAWAAIFQQLPVVQLLISRGADLYKQDENGQCPLDHAEATLNSHICEELRDAMRANPKKEED